MPGQRANLIEAAEASGHSGGLTLKNLQSGVIFCRMLEQYRPKSVPLRKLNDNATNETDYLSNFRLLQAGIDKLNSSEQDKFGFIKNDIDNLTKGQPQALNELLQRMVALKVEGVMVPTKEMENASLNAGGGTKRRRAKGGLASVAEACSSPFKRTKSATDQSGSRLLGEPMLPGTAAPVAEDMEEEEEAAPTAAEAALRDQMARQTARHLVEMRALREERDFYLRKLEAVEGAASALGEEQCGTILTILVSRTAICLVCAAEHVFMK